MTAMSLRGYCRTLSERMACKPAIRTTRLTTIARTGRLTKRSVNLLFIHRPFYWSAVRLPSSVVVGLGSRIVAGLDLVVDADGGAVAQLERARRHHLLA